MNTLSETVLEGFRLQPFRESSTHKTRPPLFEQLIQERPSPEMYSSLFQRLARERAWELAERQGVKPVREIKELQGDFWPEEESVDEFLAWVRATRQQDKVGVDE
jgi:hypothetical protein